MTNREKVNNIFIDFFGEDKVDTSPAHHILVYFPNVKVTNENGFFIDITELYVKVHVTDNGSMGHEQFQMARAEFTEDQFYADYSHSHLPGITTGFEAPCLGNGPIRQTCHTLIAEGFSSDIWSLFCVELAKYVETESLAGGPYRKLASVSVDGKSPVWNCATRRINYHPDLDLFVDYLIANDCLEYNFTNGQYHLAYDSVDLTLTLSNLFIDWCNLTKHVPAANIFIDTILCDHVLYQRVSGFRRASSTVDYEDRLLCRFKGEEVRIHIIPSTKDEEDNPCYKILVCEYLSYIIIKLLRKINFIYGLPSTIKDEYTQEVTPVDEKFIII